MDWVDLAWPWYLKEYQRESTNLLDQMMYPKVQKLVHFIQFYAVALLLSSNLSEFIN